MDARQGRQSSSPALRDLDRYRGVPPNSGAALTPALPDTPGRDAFPQDPRARRTIFEPLGPAAAFRPRPCFIVNPALCHPFRFALLAPCLPLGPVYSGK